DDHEERREAHPAMREERRPPRVAHRARPDHEKEQRVREHHQRGDALREPILQAVVRADDDAVHHMRTAIEAAISRLTMKTAKALRGATCRLVPTSMSRNRCRTPAHMWWSSAQIDAIARSFQPGSPKIAAAFA